MTTVGKPADREDRIEGLRAQYASIAAKFIEWNYFYVMSAVLMMLGCYMLMRSPVIEGSKFAQTLKALLILQGYEILLIVTAVVIVRRLKILDDALTLLLLEMVLLLDPTFFSNAFFTMPAVDGAYVNIVCFLLVPIKLGVLLKALRLRMSPRMFGAFLAACAVVFLAEGPLSLDPPPLGRNGYYYLLAWMPLVVAFLLPPMRQMVQVQADKEGYITDVQRAFLPRFLMIAPVAIAGAHFIESSFIYTVRCYPMHTVPLLMALAVLGIRNTDPAAPWQTRSSRCYVLDGLCVLSVLLSIPYEAVTGEMAAIFSYTGSHPAFVLGRTPMLIATLAAVAIYVYFYAKLHYPPALYRVVGIAAVCGGGLLIKLSLPSVQSIATKLLPLVKAGAAQTPGWLWDNFTKPGILLCVVLLVLAVKLRKKWAWLLFGALTACWFLNVLPRNLYASLPRLVECPLILALILDHLFLSPGNKQRRYALAAGIVAVSVVRYLETPAGWTFAILAAQVVALIAAGWRLKHPYYNVVALVPAVVVAFCEVKRSAVRFHPSVLVVAGGLASFLVGILVTIYKRRILVWLESAARPLAPEEPKPLDDGASEPSQETSEEAPAAPAEAETQPEPEAAGAVDVAVLSNALEAPDIVLGDDLEPDQRMRIIAAAKPSPDEKLLICLRKGSAIDDWVVIVTNKRLIVRQPFLK